MTITVYSFERADGSEFGSYTTQDAAEAKARGAEYGLRVIATEFTPGDSEIAWDFTDIDDEQTVGDRDG